MNIKRIILEEAEEFEWIKKISDKWKPKEGDKFICKPGFNRNPMSDDYGGAAYVVGRVYTIDSIREGYFDGDTIFYVLEDENRNGVYKKATEPYF